MKSKLSAFLFAILIGIAGIAVSITPFGQSCELSLLDAWFSIRGTISPPSDIVVVALDEQSYSELSVELNRPWPRALHAELLAKLRDLGAKRVVFDILFFDKGADAAADQKFAESINKIPSILGIESAVLPVEGSGGKYSIEKINEPYEPFYKAAAGVGLVGLPEEGGSVRRFFTERSNVTADLLTLSEAAAGRDPSQPGVRPGPYDLIRYYGPSRTIRTFSVYQLLSKEKQLPQSLFKDKIVVVGLVLRSEVGPAQKDVFKSPFGRGSIFGAEIHATAAANLLEGRWIKRATPTIEIIATFLITAALALLFLTVNPVCGATVAAFVIIMWALGSFISFQKDLFLPGVVPMLIFTPLTLLGSTLYYYLIVRRSAQQMKSAFELYLSPQMAKELGSARSVATLGGEKLWCTALFTDIAGFTAITEEMPAEKVSEMLNAYFTEVMEVVFQNQGTLIKFIGDAVFVLWGAPIKVPNHAELAIKTALAIDREVERFNKTGRFPALKTRIGINTGPMVVGNLGSKKRFDYTAIGDSVNLASRIEGTNKYFGTNLLFTESTKKEAGSAVTPIRIGSVRVLGKREVVNLYTILITTDLNMVTEWEQALGLFEKRDFSAARVAFERFITHPELSATATFYIGQCNRFVEEAPPERWSGELVFDSK